jgi:hypothetical protein
VSVWEQGRVPGLPAKFPMGLWLTYRKLGTAAFLPIQRDRQKLRLTTPYWYALDFSLPPQLNAEDRISVTSPFWIVCLMGSSSVEGAAGPSPGFRAQFYDAGRKQRFSYQSENNGVLLGSAQEPFWLRRLYLLRPNSPLVCRVQNLDTVGPGNNAIQIVVYGYQE